LESDVTAALTRASDVDTDRMAVSADHGVVTLSGDVDVAGDRSAPQSIAHQVAGVTAVRNELSVLHAGSTAAVPPGAGVAQ
jgi:osmotically-inducible protein OsmY